MHRLRKSEVAVLSSWNRGPDAAEGPGTLHCGNPDNKGSGISVLWVAVSRASDYPSVGDCVFEDSWHQYGGEAESGVVEQVVSQ